mmetsp:Transcript_5395/g.9327  ORF Transcript_5395/g.9327 Transcript_5395/m.9327 type:complete len:298 (+) Transcript_5395:85-978(+)|eukprot:CAMPEP_0119109674 /NCGR_PEP_ID=MMETSP1180-20130426/21974_1 /TAXON_ID=3052 ORGANISM="Chlamydomonas cf sp, Strain CCMP681" /NCGR_SAMPLE_ID=MMETSP1180 /ASSEMBLY_ACC=CAM_ASM_000741 /LENGTH=297 /DNA_ID=CAMNT_0007095559 /DNA_START=52 /DNA_END=945 /DNA_ORIENTATION=-
MALQAPRALGAQRQIAGSRRTQSVMPVRIGASVRARQQSVCESSKAKFFVGGNWKANGTMASTEQLCKDLNEGVARFDAHAVDVVVTPTALHLHKVKSLLNSPYRVGSQNVWLKGPGAYTGELPAELLLDAGAEWTLVGHSERRGFGETNEVVGLKTQRALECGLAVIACIGESLDQRNGGELFTVLEGQVQAVVDHVKDWSKIVVAYEPVWAIGTGVVATPDQAQEVHAYLRKILSEKLGASTASTLRIIYGGSVNDENCAELAGQPDIDGFLVGGASLKASSFLSIVASHKVKTA